MSFVRYASLGLLVFMLFLLGGCRSVPEILVGPQGGGAPLPLSDGESAPSLLLPQRPMRRQRRNAALGRSVAPVENAACAACGGGTGCDYPLWLELAQKKNGLYLAYDRQAALGGGPAGYERQGALVFSPIAVPAEPNGLLPWQDFAAPAGSGLSGAGAVWGSLFADWCLAQARNPKTGQPYERPAPGGAAAENWLRYGVSSEACLGALMIAAQPEGDNIAFCLGALALPLNEAADDAREGIIYLGLGVKKEGAGKGRRIGLVVFAAAEIAAFRLPAHYRPCKEHFKLEHTIWADLFREKMLAHERPRPAAAAAAGDAAYSPLPINIPPAAAQPAFAGAGAGAGADKTAALYASAGAPAGSGWADDQALQAAIERELQEQDWSGGEFQQGGFAGRQDFGRPAPPLMSKWS